MPIDAISSSSGANPYQQTRNDFQALSAALQSGNLTSAQKAYAAIQSDQQNGGAQPPADSQIAKDFAALGDALQSGDISGAQDAFSSLKTDFQSLRQARGPHGRGGGHHGGENPDDADTADSTDNSQKAIASQVSAANADGTLTVTITYTDGSTSTSTAPNPSPVVSQSPLTSDTNQLAALLTAQEQAFLNPAQ